MDLEGFGRPLCDADVCSESEEHCRLGVRRACTLPSRPGMGGRGHMAPHQIMMARNALSWLCSARTGREVSYADE